MFFRSRFGTANRQQMKKTCFDKSNLLCSRRLKVKCENCSEFYDGVISNFVRNLPHPIRLTRASHISAELRRNAGDR